MSINYKARNGSNAVIRMTDNAIIGPENETDWVEYQTWLSQGNTILEADPIPVIVPFQVPMWSVRVILKRNNLFDQAQTAIDASNDDALKAVWEYGNTANRNSPAIASLAAVLNLTSEQVDNMFVEANELNV